MEQYFKAVKVEDELPQDDNRFFVFTKDENGVTFERRASFYNHEWIIDLSFEYETVTHWLKPCPQPDEGILSKEDADFIWSLMPEWVKDNGTEADAYDPMFFGTLSREGDIKVSDKVKSILFKQSTEPKQG